VGNPLSAKGKVLTAMIGANRRLYLAGHCRGGTGAFLQAHAMQDGKLLGEWPLPAAPLRDALASAYGRLYVCTDDGSVIALGQ